MASCRALRDVARWLTIAHSRSPVALIGSGPYRHRFTVSTDTTPASILRPLADDLRERRAAARLGGGEERIARQHAAGKLTARERIALLVDDGTFTELGIHAGVHHSVRGLEGREAPADGVITGYGLVDGRHVAVCAYDFTVMAGSMGTTGE